MHKTVNTANTTVEKTLNTMAKKMVENKATQSGGEDCEHGGEEKK